MTPELAEKTWAGPMCGSMWGSAGVGAELLCDGWLYHATSNGEGLHLKAGEYCEYQWTKAAPVEVSINNDCHSINNDYHSIKQ